VQRPFLIILCGVPCAGKSTLASELAARLEGQYGHSTVVVSSDTFRRMIPTYQARFEPELEHFVRDAAFETVRNGLKNGLLVISDDINYYASIRRKLVRAAEECRADYAIVYVNTPLEVALDWNRKRGEPVPNSLVEEVYYKLDEPGKEYRWDKPFLTVDPSKGELKDTAELAAMKIHEKTTAVAGAGPMRKAQPRARSPRADLERETRRAMGEVMKRLKTLSLAEQISEVRREVLDRALKEGMSGSEASRLFFERTESLLAGLPKQLPEGRVMLHVGLFGHVDHGKTKLAACLTEKASTAALDKHPEAQRRQMTIDMGFSAFHLGKFLVTLVDLPGHYSLIKQAMAGANIIDVGVLVVAADEGPEVQTLEHLQILNALGIEKLVVALNKVDLVDQKRLNAVGPEVEQLLGRTRFAGAPIVRVCATKCEGVDELRSALLQQIAVPIRQWSGGLKVPVDHAFSIAGIGTVVTGTVLRGRVKAGDVVEVRPSGKQCKVKLLQIFSEDVNEASAGDRVGMALADVRPKDIARGYVIVSPGSLKESVVLDVRLHVESEFKPSVLVRSVVHVNVGLETVTGKVFPYSGFRGMRVLRDKVDSGAVCNALLVLERPLPVEVGDRALLMKLDLPPKQFRVIGLGEIIGLPEAEVEVYSAKVKVGFVESQTADGQWVVSGLFQSRVAAEQAVGGEVASASKVKGTVSGATGEKGKALVKFEKAPAASERVYFYRLRRATVV
jgi:selenocysteine-specific elongation factor